MNTAATTFRDLRSLWYCLQPVVGMNDASRPEFLPSCTEQEAMIASSGPARYTYFVKRVVAWGCAWGLWDDGWVHYGSQDAQSSFLPLWPAASFAERCATSDWADCRPKKIPTGDLVGQWLSGSMASGSIVVVFPVPTGSGVLRDVADLRANLLFEGSKYPSGSFDWYDQA